MKFIQRLESGLHSRMLAVGSSNTECCYSEGLIPGWFSWVEYILRRLYGRFFIAINSGISGQTSGQVVDRLEETVVLYQPQLVFVTVGGNDANPKHSLSVSSYRDNLRIIFDRLEEIPECEVIYQSYYAPIYSELEQGYPEKFIENMQKGIEYANERKLIAFDHLPVWGKLKEKLGEKNYKKELFVDSLHLNALGNQLWAKMILDRMVMPQHMLQISHYFNEIEKFEAILKS